VPPSPRSLPSRRRLSISRRLSDKMRAASGRVTSSGAVRTGDAEPKLSRHAGQHCGRSVMDPERSCRAAGPRVQAVYVAFCGPHQSARSPHGTHKRLEPTATIHRLKPLCCNGLTFSTPTIRGNPQRTVTCGNAKCAILKSAQSGFESDWGHGKRPGRCAFGLNVSTRNPAHSGVAPALGGSAARESLR
jgi:hypothetical protein